jgi:hypothetical protein
MPAIGQTQTPPRTPGRRRATPAESGLPDPRPLTEYEVSVEETPGGTRVKITLDAPCVLRKPVWAFIDAGDGSRVYAQGLVILDNTVFELVFDGTLAGSVGFVEVPYQDMQVQNFQGGFVRPGARWFRTPVL